MIYFFDGTKAGFLTAFLQAFCDEHALVTSRASQLRLGETSITVITDEPRANRVAERLLCFDKRCMRDLDYILRAGEENNEQTAFAYLRVLANAKRPVRDRFANEAVFAANAVLKRVEFEIHRFHGFIRFTECANGVLYAPFSPDNDICDLLVPHFRARFPNLPFLLHDIKRKKAAAYDGTHSFVLPLNRTDILLSEREYDYQALWKRYYEAVNIPSRARERQMRGFMPVRYWQFLTEKQDED